MLKLAVIANLQHFYFYIFSQFLIFTYLCIDHSWLYLFVNIFLFTVYKNHVHSNKSCNILGFLVIDLLVFIT